MRMRHVDMRKLPAAAQEERRRQVVGLRQRGLTFRAIAGQVGLSRTGVIGICQRFAAEGARGLVSRPRGAVFWGDETGLRPDDVRGRSDAPRGRTPLVRVCRRRAGLSLVSAVTSRGELRWMVVDGAVDAPT